MPGEGEYFHITWLLDSCLCNHALIREQYLMKKKHPSKKHKESKGPNKRVQAENDDDDDDDDDDGEE